MEYTRKQVSFLEGLKEGLGVSSTSREGKILLGVLEVFHAVIQDLEDLVAQGQYLEDYIVELDGRLEDIEQLFREPEEEQDLFEFLCPLCEEGFFLSNSRLTVDEITLEVTCPYCGTRLETELAAEEEGVTAASHREGHHREGDDGAPASAVGDESRRQPATVGQTGPDDGQGAQLPVNARPTEN